jgi:hypothetical protein
VTEAIYRYEVPVDDDVHPIELSGKILHVGCRDPRTVEFWALHSGGPTVERVFCVVGTGHPIPDGWTKLVGTAIAPGGHLVWHLLEGSW